MFQSIYQWVLAVAIHLFVHRSIHSKCPACGYRKRGEIRWFDELAFEDKQQGALVRRCKVCGAMWAVRPLVNAEAWKIKVDPKAFDPKPKPEEKKP